MRKRFSICVAALSLVATSAQAADFSFVGNLSDPDEVLYFDFVVDSTSTVTLRSYSYAGGVNARGETIARGGFDPILSLYNSLGNRIGQQDDSDDVPADSVTGEQFDVSFSDVLDPGSYTVAVSAYSNFCLDTLAQGCRGGGSFTDVTGDLRDTRFAFDVLNVSAAEGPGAVPEPATWAMMILGFGTVGYTLRRRRVTIRGMRSLA